jgi:polysaccharide deacetylase 2 family uncharacterized protein YibQ
MRFLLLKIALTVLLVLSLFMFLLHLYYESGTQQKVHDQEIISKTVSSASLETNTSITHIKALFSDKNRTLELKYKTVASEIMDYVHSKKRHKTLETNQTGMVPKKFVSKCSQPIQKITKTVVKEQQIVRHKEEKSTQPQKPRVVIIMDDVQSLEQADMIKQLPFAITPSIFPVTSDHPDTQRVAEMFSVFMIHTPMEAYHFSAPEENTLHINDSLETIDARIAEIKHDFPALTAINNHTGSKFTSDEEAMDKLFCILEKYGIPFVDSRTSVETKGREMGRLFHRKVLERNIFLDNEDNVTSILNRLKETVSFAKAHQQAIAICHPKPATFEALMQAVPLLEDVDVVTIEKLY